MPLGDEAEGRLAPDHHVVGPMGEHKDRHPVEPVLAPSGHPVVDLAAGDHRSRGGEQRVIEQARAVWVLPEPGVEDLPSLAKPRRVLFDVWAGDEAIHRHRDLKFHCGHVALPAADVLPVS
jgi:hypothetical protein